MKFRLGMNGDEFKTSLPVRGAWIEMMDTASDTPHGFVAPRAGSVDLNTTGTLNVAGSNTSLPVRGAWIEIYLGICQWVSFTLSLPVRGAWIEMRSEEAAHIADSVAPRAGSVD